MAASDRRGCADMHRTVALSRRAFVKAGMIGAAGLSLADLLRSDARASSPERVRSVIILWMRGGPSQFETWDPKPEAPVEYRGEFGVINTNVPGVVLGDYLPRSARIMDKWSIVRSLHHNDAGHSTGDQICFTGYNAGSAASADIPNVHPSCGSVVSRQIGHLTPHIPSYVCIPKRSPGTDAAYLGAAHRPFETNIDPATPGPFRLPNFSPPEGIDVNRIGHRRDLLRNFDSMRRDVDRTGQVEGLDRYHQQAWDMLTSNAARDAFDLDKEPRAVRERYGFRPPFRAPTPDRCDCAAWSQRILLARRLVEAGVRLVTVELGWWDTHVLGFESLRLGFLDRWDQAYSALIEDLDQRGLLSSTLVVSWGEFGRTPRVNPQAGRDHYPNCFSAALAGGPVRGGRVVGESDARGAFPRANPKTPQDVLATMYDFLGVDTTVQYLDGSGRPHPVLPSGRPINELWS